MQIDTLGITVLKYLDSNFSSIIWMYLNQYMFTKDYYKIN